MSEPISDELELRPAGPNDAVLIGRLLVDAFGRVDESRLVGTLRTRDDLLLEMVASDGMNILGHVLFSLATAGEGDAATRIAILAPLAVRPDLQRRGIGTKLVEAALKRLRAEDLDLAMVVGDPAYYTRFGFSPELGQALETPWLDAPVMAMELREGAARALPATVTVPAPLAAFE